MKIWMVLSCMLFSILCLMTGCSSARYVTMNADPNAVNEDTARTQGIRYLLGRGIPQDDNKAFYYFLQAAKHDDAFSQNEVAYLYATGRGTTRDYHEAITWYQKAAMNGDLPSARYNLGLLYFYGLGTTRNRLLAYQLFNKAAAQGFLPAKQILHQLF